MDVVNAIKLFLKNKESFRVVECVGNSKLITSLTRQLLVLDSSFNPPHLGHLSMIRQSLLELSKKKTENKTFGVQTINTNSVLLLFSVKNADKDSVSIEEYAKRLEMVTLMSKYINQELGIYCGVALTDASLFVDKSTLINNWIRKESENKIENYFLLGFDTIIRFFNKKYYVNSIVDSLNPFFKQSNLIVFIRDDKSSQMSITDQVEYLENIKRGNLIEGNDITKLPDNWKDRILYCEAKNEWGISSSGIRREIEAGNGSKEWEGKVISAIRNYIKENGLYHPRT